MTACFPPQSNNIAEWKQDLIDNEWVLITKRVIFSCDSWTDMSCSVVYKIWYKEGNGKWRPGIGERKGLHILAVALRKWNTGLALHDCDYTVYLCWSQHTAGQVCAEVPSASIASLQCRPSFLWSGFPSPAWEKQACMCVSAVSRCG